MDKTYWRAAFEAYAALAWMGSAMAAAWVMGTGRLPPAPFWAIAGFSALMAVYRLSEAWTVWRHRSALSGKPVAWIDTETLHKKMNARPGHLWLGWGFEWTRVHLQRLYELEKVDVTTLRAPWPLRRREGPRKGNPLLHGVEPKETDIYVPIKELEGHLFVPATTGAIKTRLLALMASQAIRRSPKEAVIVVDPKGDGELLELLKRECEVSGRADDFVYFHPAFPQQSVRLDPIRNWSRTTEIASRIAALIPGESSNDPFSAFGWRVVNLISEGLILGENQRPTLKRIRRYVEGGPDQLLHNTLVSLLESEGIDWKAVIKPYLKHSHKARRPSAATSDETLALVSYYKAQRQPQGGMGIVDGLISMFDHNREHAQKMLASLIPVLTMLTAGDLAELLSPNREDPADPRPILDGAKIIESAAVVYVGLDSLADAVVGSAIGSIFLADLTAVAGARYNQQIDDPPINLFVDEANEAVNPPFIQLLNKARSAGFRVAFFSQTVPDFIAKLGNEALARQVLGNANTTIAGRTKDKITAQYAMETFGRTILHTVHTQQVTSAVVGHRDITNYTTSYGDRINETLSEIVPPEALGSLPDLEYFASLSGNRLVKGRIPLIKPANRNR